MLSPKFTYLTPLMLRENSKSQDKHIQMIKEIWETKKFISIPKSIDQKLQMDYFQRKALNAKFVQQEKQFNQHYDKIYLLSKIDEYKNKNKRKKIQDFSQSSLPRSLNHVTRKQFSERIEKENLQQFQRIIQIEQDNNDPLKDKVKKTLHEHYELKNKLRSPLEAHLYLKGKVKLPPLGKKKAKLQNQNLSTLGTNLTLKQFEEKVLKEMNDEKILEQYQKSINNSTILNDNEGKLREKQQKSIIQDKKEKKETSVQQNQIIQKEDKQEQQLVKPDQQDSQIQEEEKDKIQEEEKDKIVNEGNIEKQDKSIDDQNQTVNQEIVKNE